jgi:peptidoglycan hydrolase CwlO-like protein
MTSSTSRQNLIIIAAVVIALLLGVNVFLLINKAKQDAKNKDLTAQVDKQDQEIQDLNKQILDEQAKLEALKGENEELNAYIDEQKQALEEQKSRIEQLARTAGGYDKAKAEVSRLTKLNTEFIAEIERLKTENVDLKDQTVRLSSRADSLTANLRTKTEEVDNLSLAKAALASEKESLAAENANLNQKVTVASVIKVQNLVATGYKTKGSGKPTKKERANNIDHLKICFDATANQVAAAGNEVFYVRVINPIGETLAIDELGSGIFTRSDNGEQVRYTKAADMEYSKEDANLCTNWTPNVPFQAGKYQVEIYNKGYLAGTGVFELK